MIKRDRFFWKKKLSESIGKPKDLWKTLKSLGLPDKISSFQVSALKINNTVEHDATLILEGFKIITQLWQIKLQTCFPKHPINTLLTMFLNIMNI